MESNMLKSTFIIGILIVATFLCQNLSAQSAFASISGPYSVDEDEVATYTVYYSGSYIDFTSWGTGGGTVISQNNTTLQIKWANAGNVTISASVNGPAGPALATKGITVNATCSTVSAGWIAGGDVTICAGSSRTLTLNGTSGGDGNYSYQWQYRNGTSGSFTDITNTNATAYTVPSSTTTDRQYRVKVTSCGETANTGAKYVNYMETVAGTIAASESTMTCPDSVTFTLSGHSGTIEKWRTRYRDNGGSWSSWEIFEETDDINPVSLYLSNPGTQYDREHQIRAVVGLDECDTKAANIIVTVEPDTSTPLLSGSLSGGDITVCEETTMPTLTLSGYSGGDGVYDFQWQYKHSSSGSPQTWTNVGTSSDTYTLPSNLQHWADYDYQVVVSSCGQSATSNTQYVAVDDNPSTNNPGTLTSTVSGDICPFVDVQFSFAPTSGVSTYWTYLEGYYNDEWHDYGKISSTKTIMIHDGEKFRVRYTSPCRGTILSDELTLSYIPGCNYPPETNKNFVRTEVPRVPISTELELSEASQSEKSMTYSYQDGLGRSLQSVSVGSGIGFSDVYSYSVYNPQTGRQEKQYMPYVEYGGTGGKFLDDVVSKAQSQYHTDYGDSIIYSKTEFENASSSKVLSSTGIGEEWHTNNKKQTFDYYWNDGTNGTDDILIWEIEEGANDELDKPDSDGKYTTINTLYFTQSTSEEGIVTRTATDLRGRKIVSQVKYGTGWISTYTVYDDFDRVRFIIPPIPAELALQATETSPSGDALTADQIAGFLFQTCYDKYGRAIKTKAPGAGWSYQVYDKWDRPVLSQDAAQRVNDLWSFVKYDDWNREILTGEVDLGNDTHEDLMDDALSSTVRYEIVNTTKPYGYTYQTTFPTSVTSNDLLTVHYYDDYSFLTLPNWDNEGNDYSYDNTILSLPTNYDSTIKGEATGSMVRVLATNSDNHSSQKWLNTVLYLDDKGRIIQTIGENHLGGVDKISNQYDWEGKLLNMEVAHSTNPGGTGVQTLDILTSNVYDAVGNLIEVYQQLDGGTNVLVAQYGYNIYGELVEKNLHSEDGGLTFLQSMDYNYNLRGWLDEINNSALADDGTDEDAIADDLFGARYHYTAGATINSTAVPGRYDGNIVAMETQAKNDPSGSGLGVKSVGYEYDDQSRLKNTVTDNGDLDMTSSYDENGNIKTLTRKSGGSLIDDMTYNYDANSNKLLDVEEDEDVNEGYAKQTPGNNNMPGLEYEYNEAGNLTEDQNKKIMVIGYNKFQRVDYIEFEDYTKIKNLYDASGNKLAKIVLDADDNEIGRIDYIGAIEYYDYEINQVMTDEGRAYQQNGDYFYEYFMRDHQMNNRVSFGVLPYRKVHLATMETERIVQETTPDDEGYAFSINANTRVNMHNHTPLGNESAALNAVAGRMVGPALALQVGASDNIVMEAWAKYTDVNWDASTASGLLGGLANALGLDGSSGSPTETVYNALSDAMAGVGGASGFFSESATTSEPDAFLQYILFDEDSIFYQAGFQGVSTAAFGKYENLSLGLDLSADANFTGGFIYIYVANETNKDQEVYFDDLKVTHESSTANFKVSQINDFYPFGMMTADTWRQQGYIDPGMLYQSSYAHYDSLTGYYDFLSRSYDPALGRFFAMDPAGQFSSPYNGMGNMPHLGVDPTGEVAWFVPLIVGGLINTGIQGATKGFDNGWQALGAFAVGAATTAVTMGITNGLSVGTAFANHSSGTLTFGQGFAAGIKETFSGSVFKAAFPYPLMNTAKIAIGSTTNSALNSLNAGGDVSTSFGFASYNWSQGEGSYLGKKGNSTLANIGYAFGGLANLQDLATGFSGHNYEYQYETRKGGGGIGHANVRDAETNDVIISVANHESVDVSDAQTSAGAVLKYAWRANFDKYTGGPEHWLEVPEYGWPRIPLTLNKNTMDWMYKNLANDRGLWNIDRTRFAINFGCVSYAARSLWTAGVPTIPVINYLGPRVLWMQLALRGAGIAATPYLNYGSK